MDSLVKPLERVVEATEWFIRTPALRVLHVVTSGLLRNAALQHITATELLDINTCPFFVLEAPTEPGDDGWSLRAEELRADWAGLLESAPGGSGVPPLWPEEQGATSLERFGLELRRALSNLRPPLAGLVIVLAPVWVRDVSRWCDDLASLLNAQSLAKARFILVEVDEAHALPMMKKLGFPSECVDARIDDGALRADMNARLEAAKNAPPGATGPQLVGAAGPKCSPPRRKNQPAPLSPQQREQAAKLLGVSSAALDPDTMKTLRVLVMSAAAAMRDQKVPEAVRLQREARDHCVTHGLSREAVVNELVLAGYVLQSGDPDRALEIFRDGRKRAEGANLMDMAVQAQIAVGSCLTVMKQVDEAAVAYGEAGRLGVSSGALVLAIEGYRTCGQLLASKGRLQEAATAFRRAIDTAEKAGDDIERSSSAPEAARALAKICRKRGLVQQAESLEAQAAAIEQSTPS